MGRVADFFREQSIPLGQQQRARMLSLDREFEELAAERDSLKVENLHLKAKVNPLERDIERLKNQLEQKPTPVHDLEPNEVDIMKFVGEKKSVNAADIGKGLNMHSVQVEHHLGRLLKANYIGQTSVAASLIGVQYSLSDKGNAYLVKNNLVPLRQAEQPNNPKGHPCDHCGSTRLTRAGARPDKTFGDAGVKEYLYRCLDCKQTSGFTNDEAQA